MLRTVTRGQPYSVGWYKVAGGGTITNGQYSVSGTVGQPDAGEPMTGGSYAVTGGFWSLVSAVQTPGAPTLTITLNAQLSTINISWPSPSTGFVLQQNSNPANPGGWSSYGGTVTDNGTTKSATISPPAGTWFYRLKK